MFSETPDDGSVKVGETVKISYVDQSRSGLDPTKNLWETVSDGNDYIQVGHVEIPSRAYVSQFGFKGLAPLVVTARGRCGGVGNVGE